MTLPISTAHENWLRVYEVKKILNEEYSNNSSRSRCTINYIAKACLGVFAACLVIPYFYNITSASKLTEEESEILTIAITVLSLFIMSAHQGYGIYRLNADRQARKQIIKGYQSNQILRGYDISGILSCSSEAVRKMIAEKLHQEQLKTTLQHIKDKELALFLSKFFIKASPLSMSEEEKIKEEANLIQTLHKHINEDSDEIKEPYCPIVMKCLEVYSGKHQKKISKYLSKNITKDNVKKIYAFAQKYPWGVSLMRQCEEFTSKMILENQVKSYLQSP